MGSFFPNLFAAATAAARPVQARSQHGPSEWGESLKKGSAETWVLKTTYNTMNAETWNNGKFRR